jgi:15-cis-phytoene synthase
LVAAENREMNGMESTNLLRDQYTLDMSRNFCRRFSQHSGSSFLRAFFALPKSKRQAMYAIYAFMRISDDIIDSPSTEVKKTGPAQNAAAKDRLNHWRSTLATWLPSEAPLVYEEKPASCAICGLAFDPNLIFPSLVDAVESYRIPVKIFYDVLDGMEMDLTKNRYQTFEELELYCERVASTVGLACIHIWGFQGREKPEADAVFDLARKVGIAYQLTNILRDLKEDAASDRVYLPLNEISAAGYSVEELKCGIANPAYEKLMRKQIERAESFYRASRELYARLEPDGKKIFGLMTSTYWAILKKIAADPSAVFEKRVRLGALERIRLAARWFFSVPKEL